MNVLAEKKPEELAEDMFVNKKEKVVKESTEDGVCWWFVWEIIVQPL